LAGDVGSTWASEAAVGEVVSGEESEGAKAMVESSFSSVASTDWSSFS